MPAPSTLVVFVDDDGDEFAAHLNGITNNKGADIEAGLQVAGEMIADGSWKPTGELHFEHLEYLNERDSA